MNKTFMKQAKRKWAFGAVCMATIMLCMGVFTSCSKDDEEGEKTEVRQAQVSELDTLMRRQPLNNFIFKRVSSNWEKITLATDPTVLDGHPDYYSVSFTVKDTPIANKASGRYAAVDVEAVVWAYSDYRWTVKKSLYLPSHSAEESAWVDLQYQNKTSGGYPQYSVTFHADSLLETNGDYAKNITITGTGYFGTMLEY